MKSEFRGESSTTDSENEFSNSEQREEEPFACNPIIFEFDEYITVGTEAFRIRHTVSVFRALNVSFRSARRRIARRRGIPK